MATLNDARLLDDDAARTVIAKAQSAAAATPGRAAARPGAQLAVAAAGLLAMTVLVAGEPRAAAQGAQPDSRSVSVAQALGIGSSGPLEDRSLTREGGLLEQLATSRAERETEQAAAAQAQSQAEQAALAARAEAEARAAAEAKAAAEAARPTAVMPIDAARITSSFGPRWGTLHAGVDLAAPMMTPEFAAMDGIVLQAGPASGFGLAVYIQHDNGDVTVYGHMEKILVSAGQVVRAGDTIALVGNRGESTGPHLHFEVRIGGVRGEPVDPLAYLRQRGVQI